MIPVLYNTGSTSLHFDDVLRYMMILFGSFLMKPA